MPRLVLLLAAAALLCQDACLAASVNRNLKMLQMNHNFEINNSLEDNMIPTKQSLVKNFVKIAQKPPLHVKHAAGTTLELTCDGIGSPAPSVQWLKNDVPVLEYGQESNEILDSSPTSLARVVSKLVIGAPSKNRKDVYTCLVRAGHKTARANTYVYTIGSNDDLSERYKLTPMEPRTVVWYKVYMDTIGGSAVLACRAKGHPRPRVTWQDNNGDAVPHDHPRMKVLRSGELFINNLLWSDMGEFVCTAANSFGSETVTTFVYPVQAG